MRSGPGIIKLVIFIISIVTMQGLAFGQDLGSTSGLFRSKTSTKKASTSSTKRTPVRVEKKPSSTSSTRKKTTAKRALPRAKSPTKANADKERSSKAGAKLPDNIVITVGKTTSGNSKESFEEAIAAGNDARNRRLYVQAEQAYGSAIKLDPADSRAHYGLGNIYSDQQRWEDAEASYRRALEIEPNSASANIALSYVLTQPVIGSNLGERYVKAEEIARKAIALDPANAIGYDQLGVAMELRGLISTETEQAYQKAIDLDPGFAVAYAHLGRLMRKRGRTNESSAAYREAMNLSTNVPTMILVADVMQSQQRYLDSEQLLRAALRSDPRNPTALYLLGRALITRKSFDEAEALLLKNLSVSPQSFVSYMTLGSLYYQSGDLGKAEQTLNRTLSFVSENEKKRLAQEFEIVADGLMKLRRNTDAARVYRRAISLDGEKSSLAAKLAIAERGE